MPLSCPFLCRTFSYSNMFQACRSIVDEGSVFSLWQGTFFFQISEESIVMLIHKIHVLLDVLYEDIFNF